jgi:hypothetical protein
MSMLVGNGFPIKTRLKSDNVIGIPYEDIFRPVLRKPIYFPTSNINNLSIPAFFPSRKRQDRLILTFS